MAQLKTFGSEAVPAQKTYVTEPRLGPVFTAALLSLNVNRKPDTAGFFGQLGHTIDIL